MTTTPPPGPTCIPRGFGFDPKLGAAALRAPAASREDSRPQAILKFHRPSSLDYRARHGLPVAAPPSAHVSRKLVTNDTSPIKDTIIREEEKSMAERCTSQASGPETH